MVIPEQMRFNFAIQNLKLDILFDSYAKGLF
jgi:hypothetical protein